MAFYACPHHLPPHPSGSHSCLDGITFDPHRTDHYENSHRTGREGPCQPCSGQRFRLQARGNQSGTQHPTVFLKGGFYGTRKGLCLLLLTAIAGWPWKPGLGLLPDRPHYPATPSEDRLEDSVASHRLVAQRREDLLDLGSYQKLPTCFYCRSSTRRLSLVNKALDNRLS